MERDQRSISQDSRASRGVGGDEGSQLAAVGEGGDEGDCAGGVGLDSYGNYGGDDEMI